MSDCTLISSDGTEFPIMNGDVLFPYFGNWSANLVLSGAESAPSGPCTMRYFTSKFSGFVLRSGQFEGQFYCMVVGGAGGLSTEVSSTGYNYNVKVSLPLSQMLAEVKETISLKSDVSYLNKILPSWNRLQGSCSVEVSKLIDFSGGLWRVVDDGGVFVGVDSFQVAPDFSYTVLSIDPIHATARLSLESLSLLPGMRFPQSDYDNLSERKIGACRYLFTQGSSQLTLWFLEEEGVYTDALHAGLETFVKEVMRGVDYLASYPSRVIEQRADGTVDIQPDSDRVPPMTSVPLKVDNPGFKHKIPANSRGNLKFEQGNPQKFVFTEFEMGPGGRKVSGVGDQVNLGYLVSTKNMTGAITALVWDATAGDIPLGPGDIKTGWPNLEIGPEMS